MKKLNLVVAIVLIAGIMFSAKAQVVESVTFMSQGEQIAGNLFFPADYQAGDVLPAIVFNGRKRISIRSVCRRVSRKRIYYTCL